MAVDLYYQKHLDFKNIEEVYDDFTDPEQWITIYKTKPPFMIYFMIPILKGKEIHGDTITGYVVAYFTVGSGGTFSLTIQPSTDNLFDIVYTIASEELVQNIMVMKIALESAHGKDIKEKLFLCLTDENMNKIRGLAGETISKYLL